MKKLLAMLLSVLMLVSCFALSVSADDNIYNDVELDWGEYKGLFAVGGVEAKAGEEVVVPVSIERNPGIVSLKLVISYDPEMLELISAEGGDFGSIDGEVPSLSYGPIENNPFIINWFDALTLDNNTDTGVIANLTFLVKEGAEGSTEIAVDYNANDVFDADLNNVEFACNAGSVTVKTHTPGDVNNDGKVNIRDLGALQQYLNGWDVDINLDAANVTGDANINIRDLGLLQQYVNGWPVELV